MLYQKMGIISAKKYYDYLAENQLGESVCKVLKIECGDHKWILHLEKKLPYYESVKIRIFDTTYEQSAVELLEYNEMARTLMIRAVGVASDEIKKASAKDVLVISDLKFLVKRVEEWYRAYGNKVQFPTVYPNNEVQENLLRGTSDDQKAAIVAALTNPFVYVWGAPGTGKTRFVLARCILNYIQQNKKILLVAPTNVALEQSLYGLLGELENRGINVKEDVLRIGTPSTGFATQYPDICESQAVEKKLEQLNKELKCIDQEIEEKENLIGMMDGYRAYRDFMKNLEQSQEVCPPLFEKLITIKKENDADRQKAAKKQTVINALNSAIQDYKNRERELERRVKMLAEEIDKCDKGLFPILKKKKKLHLNQLFIESIYERNRVYADLKELLSERDREIIEKEELENRVKLSNENFESTVDLIAQRVCFWKGLQSVMMPLCAREPEKLSKFFSEYIKGRMNDIEGKAEKYRKLEKTSEKELKKEKEILEQRKEEIVLFREELRQKSTEEKIQRCKVLAATTDTVLSRVCPQKIIDDEFGEEEKAEERKALAFYPDHIFLDEAGYCALIKGATLAAFGCPVTFLGDHMQLPPVCEMSDEKIGQKNNHEVVLWAQSALYFEEAMKSDEKKLVEGYLNHEEASFKELKKQDLVQTYRFGDNLARVLAEEVYAKGFWGNKNRETKIFCIHAHRTAQSEKRSSAEEVNAIVEYVKNNPKKNIGIITPYRKQRDLLKRSFRGNQKIEDEILTVHGSQGREWDTVIFSVVDTDDKWFTTIKKPQSNGKKLVNTAISRVKKELIIVCDRKYWESQEEELIGKLVAISQEIWP